MAAKMKNTASEISDLTIEKDIQAPDEQPVCTCFDFSLGQMRSMLAKNPTMSFDSFLADSNAGTKCTACLLDLEYYFVHLPRKSSGKIATKQISGHSSEPLRRKVYRWIDKLSPRRAIPLKDHVPIIAGPDIEQWAWVANYGILYAKDGGVPDFDIKLRLFDASGQLAHQQDVTLPLGQEWHGELAQYLPKPASGPESGDHPDLSIGWLEITRLAQSDGVRGTTRPQIEIVTSKSSCAVHGQSAGIITGNEFDMICLPKDDRVFVSLINPGTVPVEITMKYPFDPLEQIKTSPRTKLVTLPPRGAVLHEVVLTDDEKQAFSERLFNFAWSGTGFYKAHVIIASTQLDRFSIDHA